MVDQIENSFPNWTTQRKTQLNKKLSSCTNREEQVQVKYCSTPLIFLKLLGAKKLPMQKEITKVQPEYRLGALGRNQKASTPATTSIYVNQKKNRIITFSIIK